MTTTPTTASAGAAGSSAPAASPVQGYFDDLVTWATSRLRGDEVLTAWLGGEDSDFVRFNDGAVRQAGSVRQRSLSVDLIAGDVHTAGEVQLAQDADLDRARVGALLDQLREQRALVPPDPYLSFATDVISTQRVDGGDLPAADDAIDQIRAAGDDRDLVGIYAAGDSFAGFANSLGQRNWFQSTTFNLDWSFYLRADKAVKSLYAGRHWDQSAFQAKVDRAGQQLAVLARPPVDLTPGDYRTFLTPTALTELFELLSYDAFGIRAHRTRQTSLLRMITEGATFDPRIRLIEDTANGVAPDFQAQGFLRPPEVVLVDGGVYGDTLVSPRSALEYGVPTNGASGRESPTSLTMAGGDLADDAVLDRLDTGLYIGNLWYLNYSDPAACRTTGMTRFATFWVEGGEIVAPANVLRFDDTAYNLLGTNLEGLTSSVDTMLDPGSYGGRSMASFRLPGALVGGMRFTL